jgi:hypothetical protein
MQMVMYQLIHIKKTLKDLSFISVGKEDGKMDIAFQIECPGVNF